MKKIRVGALQKKLLILLAGGFSLALSRNPRQYFKILKEMGKEWDKVNKDNLKRAIKSLYESKLVGIRDVGQGCVELILNKEGKDKVLCYKIEEFKIKIPKQWDRKWRLVIFDIPETLKKAREAFRSHLKRFGFYQFQRSVFVLPYDCRDEIEFLVEFYSVRPYVRLVIAESFDNEPHLKKIFKLF